MGCLVACGRRAVLAPVGPELSVCCSVLVLPKEARLEALWMTPLQSRHPACRVAGRVEDPAAVSDCDAELLVLAALQASSGAWQAGGQASQAARQPGRQQGSDAASGEAARRPGNHPGSTTNSLPNRQTARPPDCQTARLPGSHKMPVCLPEPLPDKRFGMIHYTYSIIGTPPPSTHGPAAMLRGIQPGKPSPVRPTAKR